MGEMTHHVDTRQLGDMPSLVMPYKLNKLLQMLEIHVLEKKDLWVSNNEEEEAHLRKMNT